MRFNQRELAFIALQHHETLDYQGLLWLKEKDGFFWQRTESYTERWCRLKGNLLFYCKANDKVSEIAGLIVLERCAIIKDLLSTKKYAFSIIFDQHDESQHYHFAANSDSEFNEWNERIKNASYEKLKEKLHNLREQLTEITGEDPLPDSNPLAEEPVKPRIGDHSSTNTASDSDEFPLLEISIACNELEPSTDHRLPNAFVIVSTMTPPGSKWSRHAQTEIIEQNSDPYFLTTVVLPSDGKFSEVTRLKLAVFDVRDRDKEEMTHLGQAVCTIGDVLNSTNQKIQLSLTGLDSPTPSGTITLLGWKMGNASGKRDSQLSVTDAEDDLRLNRSRCGSVNKPKFDGLLQRSYIFPTIVGSPVKVVEMMGESFLTFRIPQQLLKIFITEEKQKILDLNNLGNLSPEWDNVRQEILDNHFKLVSNYTGLFRHLNQKKERQDKGVSSGLNFKPSRLKSDKRLAFITTNLHLQRLKVTDGLDEHVYDIVTFGAPSAHSMKYSKGGLRRLMGNLREAYFTQNGRDNKANRAKTKRVELEKLKLSLTDLCEGFKRALIDKSLDAIIELTSQLKEQSSQLVKYYDLTFIIDSLVALSSSRPPQLRLTFSDDEKGDFLGTSPVSTSDYGPECQVLRTTIETSVEQISLTVSQLSQHAKKPSQVPNTFAHLKEIIGDLSRGIDALVKEFNLGMVFVLLQEESRHVQVMQVLRQRRDVCLSQAVTALICGFEAKVYTSLSNPTFLKQLCEIGVLVEFESLLSTYGDEMGMLEDMSIAVRDLSTVKFKFACSDSDVIPYVTGTRTNMQVTILLETEYFCQLPNELQEGKPVRIFPVLFTQGINENATLAERFGDTSLQEAINDENFGLINFYYEKFRDNFPNEAEYFNSREPPLLGLIEHLKTNISSRKSKNVDILFLSQEICWRMNGIRFTSCKSAKDRTSMSVTLEQCSILKRKHNMQPEQFNHAIDAMRSEGTRRENCFKNAGIRRYAFNYWQVMALPRAYRPPYGTYGKNIQA